MNTNYVDLFVFIFLLFEFFVGINRGAILFIFDIVGVFLGLFLSNTLAPHLSAIFINNLRLDKTIADKISGLIVLPQDISNLSATVSNVSKAISELHLPIILQNFVLSNGIIPSMTVKEFIALKLSQYLVNAISYVIIFAVVIIIARIVALVLRKLFRVSPFLKWIDVILGGVLRIAIVFTVISVFVHALGFVFSYLDLSNSQFASMLVKSRTYYISENYFKSLSTYLTTLLSNFK